MSQEINSGRRVERPVEKWVGRLGLLLLGLTGWACEQLSGEQPSRVAAIAARLTLGAVKATGWLVDCLASVVDESGVERAGGTRRARPSIRPS